MLINKIAADVNPSLWNSMKKSTVSRTAEGLSETFNNGYKLLTNQKTGTQTVVDAKGNVVMYQVTDSKSGKTYII